MTKLIAKSFALAMVFSLAAPLLASAQTVSGRLVKMSGDPTIYIVAPNGSKRPVASSDVFNAAGFSFKKVGVVSQTTLKNYPETVVIKIAGSPAIYRLNSDMTKQLIGSWQAFLDLGLKPADVVVVTPAELNAYTRGEDIISGAGRQAGFEQGLNSRNQSMVAAALANTVNLASLGSNFSSRAKDDAAATIVSQFPAGSSFTFITPKELQKEIPASLLGRALLAQYRDYTFGYTGKTVSGDRAGIAYRVNSDGLIDRIIYAPSLCSVAAPLYQCQK